MLDMSAKDAFALHEALRTAPHDRKLDVLVQLRRFVKRNDLDAVPALVDALRTGLAAGSPALSAESVVCLAHLVKRVALQDAARLRTAAPVLGPLLVERLGDLRDRPRDAAHSALAVLWRSAPSDIERCIRDHGFAARSSHVREQAVRWAQRMHAQAALPLRCCAGIVRLLEDANDAVRDAAKAAVLDLYRDAPPHARAELRRELADHRVRKKTAAYITDLLDDSASRSDDCSHDDPPRRLCTETTVCPGAPAVSPCLDHMDPAWVHSARELETEIHDIAAAFEGRETDTNWVVRERHIARLRALLRGNACRDHAGVVAWALRLLTDGIVRAIGSLRTTLSLAGLQLVKDAALVGAGLDQPAEALLGSLVRASGQTKKIVARAAQVVGGVLVGSVSYQARIVQQVVGAAQDKNASTRQGVWRDRGSGAGDTERGVGCTQRGPDGDAGGAAVFPGAVAREGTEAGGGGVGRADGGSLVEGLDAVARRQLERALQGLSMGGQTGQTGQAGRVGKGTGVARREEGMQGGLQSGAVRQGVGRRGEGGEQRGGRGGRGSPRKLTVGEQLVHGDWRVRVEGIVTVACLLAKKEPPGYEGRRVPSLPGNEVLGGALQKLLNDPQEEVVNHLMAPEVIVEVAKVVPLEQIVPRIVLLSEREESGRGHDIVGACLPAVKKLVSEGEGAEVLVRVLTAMGQSGVVPKKLSAAVFTTSEKRKIMHGVLEWMGELVEQHVESRGRGEEGNGYFNEVSNLKFCVNRLVPMISSMRPGSENYGPLAGLLKSLRGVNEEVFDKVLQTFEKGTVNALKNAWGIVVEEEVQEEEKVACIEEVLGSVPVVGCARAEGGEQYSLSPAGSQSARYSDVFVDPFEENSAGQMNFEDMTMIQIPKLQTRVLNSKVCRDMPVSGPPGSVGVDSALAAQDAARAGDLGALDDKAGQTEQGSPVRPSQVPLASDPGKQESRDASMKDEDFSKDSGLWFRKYMKKIPTTPLPRNIDDSIRLLSSLVERLENHDMDSYAFKKLICISKEHSLESDAENHDDAADSSKKGDIWVSGSLFSSLLNALLDFMTKDSVLELKIQGLLLLKYLFDYQKLYFNNHVLNVFDYLLKLRSEDSNNSRIICAVEEIIFEIVSYFEPLKGISVFLSYLEPYISDDDDESKKYLLKQPNIVICLSSLAIFIKKLGKPELDQYLQRIPSLVIKAINDRNPEIRKECVTVCISINSVIKNSMEIFDLLQGLTHGQQNLLVYYFTKSGGKDM
ncbi:hypothetical protein PMAC_001127 [Pneumocystis sp. 'macacae']|nr:hypothetical protein PMAC_001127 [Pneumocystis sp. 'macacae']